MRVRNGKSAFFPLLMVHTVPLTLWACDHHDRWQERVIAADEVKYGHGFSGHSITSDDDVDENNGNTEQRNDTHDLDDPFPQARASHSRGAEQTRSETP